MPLRCSFIVVSHARYELLDLAIKSLLAQDDPRWEVLVVDNGSTSDGMREVLTRHAADTRFRVYRFEENLNQPAVRWNWALGLARSEFVAFLDSDCEKEPFFLSLLGGLLDANPAAGFAFGGMTVTDGRKERPHRYHMDATPERILDRNYIDGGSVLWRRTSILEAGGFDERLHTNEDWDLLRRAFHLFPFVRTEALVQKYKHVPGRRMEHRNELGNAADEALVRSKPVGRV